MGHMSDGTSVDGTYVGGTCVGGTSVDGTSVVTPINIIKDIAPQLKSLVLNEILRLILSKAELVFTQRGRGGTLGPDPIQLLNEMCYFFICLCTEWATNKFSWSYCRYLQTAGPKMQEKLSVEIISDKIQKSVFGYND